MFVQVRCRQTVAAAALAFALLPPPAPAQEQTAPATVDALVREMMTTLAEATSFTMHVEKTFDDIVDPGFKVQYSGAMDVAIRRPDRFHISYGDDASAKEAWYDGERLILLDRRTNIYGKLPAADTIDGTIAALRDGYDLELPLATLLSSDPWTEYRERANRRMYLGIHDVDGFPGHHVLVTGDRASWQFWIDVDEPHLPLKIVVTDLETISEPQTTYVFTDWVLGPDLPDETFVPALPDTAAVAEFLPRTEQ